MKTNLLSGTVATALFIASPALALDPDTDLYNYMKGTFEKIYIRKPNLLMAPEDGELYLNNCSYVSDAFLGGEGAENVSEKETDLTELAYEVAYLSRTLIAAGYPTRVWSKTLRQYENHAFDRIVAGKKAGLLWDVEDTGDAPIFIALAKKANSYRKSQASRHLPTVLSTSPGCGAGELDVTIKTTPHARRIQYINLIYFGLCEHQGKDATDEKSCSYWLDASLKAPSGEASVSMAGNYKILVTWSDGHTKLVSLPVDDQPGAENMSVDFEINR